LESVGSNLVENGIYALIDKDWWESLVEDFKAETVVFEHQVLDMSHLIDPVTVKYITDEFEFLPLKPDTRYESLIFLPLEEFKELKSIIDIKTCIFRKCTLDPDSQSLILDLAPNYLYIFSEEVKQDPKFIIACESSRLTEELYDRILELFEINVNLENFTIECVKEETTINFDQPIEKVTVAEAGYIDIVGFVVKETNNNADMSRWGEEVPSYSAYDVENDNDEPDLLDNFNNNLFESHNDEFQPSPEISPINNLSLTPSVSPFYQSNGNGKSGVVGLTNLGNTCFMNSALQCLSNTHILTEYFLKNAHILEINKNNPLGMGGLVAEAYGKLIQEIWAQGKSVISPARFKAIIGKFAPQFLGYQQHDSQEFLAFLFDGLHEDCNRIKDKPYIDLPNSDGRPDAIVAEERWELHKKRNDSIIVDLFQGMYKSTLLCPTCDHISVTFDPFMYLTLPLPIIQKTELRLVFVPHIRSTTGYKSNIRVDLSLPSTCSIYELKTILAKILKIDYRQLYVCDIFQGKVHEVLNDHNVVSSINSEDKIYIYEKAPLVTHSKIISFYLINAFPKKATNSLSYIGVPSLISMDLNEASSIKDIYEHVLEALQRYTSYDIQQIRALYEEFRAKSEESDDTISTPPFESSESINALNSSESNGIQDHSEMKSSASSSTQLPKLPFVLKQTIESQYSRYHTKNIFTLDKLEDIGSQPGESTIPNGSPALSPLFKNETNILALWDPLAVRQIFGNKSSLENSPRKQEPKFALPGEQGIEQWEHYDHLRPEHFEGVQLPKNVDLIIPRHLQRGLSVSFASPSDNNTETESIPPASGSNEDISPTMDTAQDPNSPLMNPGNLESSSHHSQPRKRTKHISLEDCIDEFLKEEELGQHDLWYCPKCKEHQQATKKFDLWSLPGILVVHLKRFSQARYLRDKIDALIDFPITDLDLTDYVQSFQLNPDQPRLVYDLYAVSNHFGGLGGGHYTAYAKNFEQDQWYCFDDSRVSPCEPEEVKTSAAYLLFYQLRGFNPPTFPTLKSLDGSSPIVNTTVTLKSNLSTSMSVSRENSSPIPQASNSDRMSVSDASPKDTNPEL
jgi:ubiquitin carboxyl-terminal hydrolase 4/11/15